MENSPSDDHVASVAARVPPVRYYVRYEEEDPFQDPDSPQSPGQLPDDFPPLVFPNPNRPPVDYSAHVEIVDDDPTPPPEPDPEPAYRRRRREEDQEFYCRVDEDDPESMRRYVELQSKRYAVYALRHYNADPCNDGGVKYELVEATGSQAILLDSGHIMGHVTFTARATTGTMMQALPRPFFAEVHMPDLVPTCIISMDDGEEERGQDDDLCQFCGDHLKHPKVPSGITCTRPKGPTMRRVRESSATNTLMDCCDRL